MLLQMWLEILGQSRLFHANYASFYSISLERIACVSKNHLWPIDDLEKKWTFALPEGIFSGSQCCSVMLTLLLRSGRARRTV